MCKRCLVWQFPRTGHSELSLLPIRPHNLVHSVCDILHASKHTSYYNSSSVCVFVCSLSPPRSFDGSSPNLVGVCRWTSELPLRGSFSKRLTGRRVNGSLSLSTILYVRQPHATQLQKAPFALLLLLQSLIRHLLLHCISTVYVGGPCNCP